MPVESSNLGPDVRTNNILKSDLSVVLQKLVRVSFYQREQQFRALRADILPIESVIIRVALDGGKLVHVDWVWRHLCQ
jgi:hypothetical protein